MRFQVRKARGYGLAAALLAAGLGGSVARGADELGRFPSDWYVLPEDGEKDLAPLGEVEERAGLIFRRHEDAVDSTLDRIFVSTADSLEKNGDTVGRHEAPASAPADWVAWHLKNLYMDLGISLAGTAGLVTGIGEASVEIQWSQSKANLERLGLTSKGSSLDAAGETNAQSGLPVVVMNEDDSKAAVESKVDRMCDTVMATGKVSDRGKMREGLLKVTDDLQGLMANVNVYNSSSWEINKFGVDVEISGSGIVSAGVSVGGAVRLRFEWKRSANKAPVAEPKDDNDEKRENLRKMLAGVANDIQAINADTYSQSGFGMTTLRLGIGMYLGVKFGVVKGKLSLMGYAYFASSKGPANELFPDKVRIVHDTSIPLIVDEEVPAHVSYADANGIKYEKLQNESSGARMTYFVSRDRFQKGLNRAAKMGAFFAKRASKSTGSQASNSHWEITQIKPQFALSLEGAIKVVTIGGKASLEMTFKRQ